MLKEEKRSAIKTLYEEGRKKKEIARLLNLDPKTVRNIVAGDGDWTPRKDKKEVEDELLRNVYHRCSGYVERVHEVLSEEYGVEIGYSTLTRLIREKGIGQKIVKRCHHVPDVPGAEMQHDTSHYKLKIGGRIVSVVGSGLYLRYSKMRYLKFYPVFNRFKMKCFFHEALTHWGYAADKCVIDNTNLAVLHGTGEEAVFHPEMESFVKPYGFSWLAHKKGHSDRKAGKERNFWTVETNFFPGRLFESIEDLNRQAFEWSTVRYAKRPQSKSRLIPNVLFEEEKPYLIKLPPYVEPPYKLHERGIDEYGYVAVHGNYYWFPGKSTGEVHVLEYADRIKIYDKNRQSIRYPLAVWNVKNQKFSPKGVNTNPYEPKNIKKPCHEEEKRVRDLGKSCCDYLDFIKSRECGIRQKPKFIRDLHGLSKKMADPLFIATVERALLYRVTNIGGLWRIAGQLMKKDLSPLPDFPVSHDHEQREAYQQGRFSRQEDLGIYQDLLMNGEKEQQDKEEPES